jgi:hypothetical protein
MNEYKKIEPYESQNQLVFTIDGDGDNFLTFNHSVDFITKNYITETIELYPGGWNTSKFIFNYLKTELTLIFNDFGGTDLRVKKDIDKLEKEKIQQLVSSIISNLEGKILTK